MLTLKQGLDTTAKIVANATSRHECEIKILHRLWLMQEVERPCFQLGLH